MAYANHPGPRLQERLHCGCRGVAEWHAALTKSSRPESKRILGVKSEVGGGWREVGLGRWHGLGGGHGLISDSVICAAAQEWGCRLGGMVIQEDPVRRVEGGA